MPAAFDVVVKAHTDALHSVGQYLGEVVGVGASSGEMTWANKVAQVRAHLAVAESLLRVAQDPATSEGQARECMIQIEAIGRLNQSILADEAPDDQRSSLWARARTKLGELASAAGTVLGRAAKAWTVGQAVLGVGLGVGAIVALKWFIGSKGAG